MEERSEEQFDKVAERYQEKNLYGPLYYFPRLQSVFLRSRIKALLGQSFITALINGAKYRSPIENEELYELENDAVDAMNEILGQFDYKNDKQRHEYNKFIVKRAIGKLNAALIQLGLDDRQIEVILEAFKIPKTRLFAYIDLAEHRRIDRKKYEQELADELGIDAQSRETINTLYEYLRGDAHMRIRIRNKYTHRIARVVFDFIDSLAEKSVQYTELEGMLEVLLYPDTIINDFE